MSDRSARQIFPETEIVDAWALLQELGLSSLDVSNGERVVGMVTRGEIEQHRASGERTFLVGSIMTLPPEIVRAPRARHAGSVPRDGTRPTVGANRQIASAVRGWLDAPSHPAP
jgi:CBS domain-containing protein